MALDERAFFNERPEQRNGRYSCPRCKRTNDYQMRWVRRTRKDRVPANADDLIRVDDELTCKTCGKRFEIPSMHSLVFVDQLDGLPKVDDEDDEPAPVANTVPAPSASAPAGSTPSTPAPRQRKGYAPPKAWR
jgi:DNA-directed RNA polymerase subunit RPC12/RpoP